MTTVKPVAAIWWRVSTKAQTDMSPETQILEAREMLEAAGYSVPDDRVIGADWHSLAVLDCPEMETLLGWVRHGEIQAIGMYHGDRLAGNPGQKMFIVDLCDRHGVKLLARHSPIIEGKEGELLEYVRTWGKEQQVIRAQQSSKDALRDRAKVNGLPPTGKAPFGYRFATRRTPQGGIEKDYTCLVRDDDWWVVNLIWQKALEGVSLRRIAKDLYVMGIRSPKGNERWNPTTIASMLHNPAYAGRVYALKHRASAPKTRRGRTYGNTTNIAKPFEEWVLLDRVVVEQPIVEWAQYERMQERLLANKNNSVRNTKNDYLLQRMIHCETHGTVFGARRLTGRRKSVVYRCRGYHEKAVRLDPCVRRSIGGAKLEETIWNKAVELLTDPERVLNELEAGQQSHADLHAQVTDALARVEKRVNQADDKEMRLVSIKLNSGISETIFERQMALLNAERAWCAEERDRLASQLEDSRQRLATTENIRALQDRIGDKLARATFKDKRFVLEALETSIAIAEDGGIRLRFSVPASPEPAGDGAFVLATP